MYERRSCFNNHRVGFSQFAEIKLTPLKNIVIDETAKKEIIQMKKAEKRREAITALASA